MHAYLKQSYYIEDLTRVAILYGIYEASLLWVSYMCISYELITSVRFCILFDPIECEFIAFKMNIISTRKHIVDTDIVSYVMCSRQSVMTRMVIRFL